MKLHIGLSLGLLSAVWAAPASAYVASPTVTTCIRNDVATVISSGKSEDVGTRFQIRPSTKDMKADCALEERPGDVVIGNGPMDALSYIRLTRNVLILDAGTGPDRALVIYQVPEGKELFSGGYSIQGQCDPTSGCETDDFSTDEKGLTFWREIAEKPTAKNCPGYAKFMKATGSAAIEEKSLFSFATLKVEPLKGRRCVQQQ
ncbi:hypothetical protein J5J86_21520 [Aquabacter sp. L1I39]|uniref:hypothetical protein n=1 Tax=Aquabacter sp. L1I39 TaxID=2820278 RepID=UPI001ADC7FE9|nr:hypothetical protein [Aquabacter sp. L1I39]QTL03292.1 hypothetical protein J5J86_21520 [Aquabacter sp. L1I39]